MWKYYDLTYAQKVDLYAEYEKSLLDDWNFNDFKEYIEDIIYDKIISERSRIFKWLDNPDDNTIKIIFNKKNWPED